VSTNIYFTKVQFERATNMHFNRVGVILGKRNLDLQKQLCHHLVKRFLVFYFCLMLTQPLLNLR